jgi:formiminotetrahydrofolate cyclodeaminase
VPAGGSVAAATVAMAASLVEKAARLSAARWDGATESLARAGALRRTAAELVEADAEAYTAFVAAMRAAKGLEGAALEAAVGPSRDQTVAVPLAVVLAAAETVDLAAALALHGNPNLRADALVAATLAAAAARSSAQVVAVNLQPAPGDPRLELAQKLARSATEVAASLGPEPAT